MTLRVRGSEARGNSVALSDYNLGGSASPSFVPRKNVFEAFAVRRLQELRRARRIPLLMFFVDLQMVKNSVDGKRLWVMPRVFAYQR